MTQVAMLTPSTSDEEHAYKNGIVDSTEKSLTTITTSQSYGSFTGRYTNIKIETLLQSFVTTAARMPNKKPKNTSDAKL